MALITGIVHQR